MSAPKDKPGNYHFVRDLDQPCDPRPDESLPPDELRAQRLYVCANSNDVTEAREFMLMLGLHDE